MEIKPILRLNWKDIHINTSSVFSIVAASVLWSTVASPWWSCGNSLQGVSRAWIWGTGALLLGGSSVVVLRHFGQSEKTKYFSELGLRLVLLYALITTALIKAEGYFFNYNLITEQSRIGEIDQASFVNIFYGSSDVYQSYLGYSILIGLLFICFNQTKRLGSILLFGILANSAIMAYSYDNCFLMKHSIYAFAALGLIYAELPSYLSFFTKNEKYKTSSSTYHPLKGHTHIYNSLGIYKIILLAGLVIYNSDYVDSIKGWRSQNKDNPIAGVWDVKTVKFLKNDNEVSEESKAAVQNFESFILDKGRWGAVKVDDSLSFFEYIVDPNYNQLEFWNFQDFRSIDLKGKYTQVSNDSLVYIGRSNRDSLIISLKLNEKKKTD